VEGVQTSEAAEDLAMRQALVITKDNGFVDIVIAPDCLWLIQKVNSLAMDRSAVGTMVGDIKRLASGFTRCSFKHVHRSLNVAAHVLARSYELSFCKIFIGVIPELYG
jgi:hypothetical protein